MPKVSWTFGCDQKLNIRRGSCRATVAARLPVYYRTRRSSLTADLPMSDDFAIGLYFADASWN